VNNIRECSERLKAIEPVVPIGGRVLDIGTNLGFFPFSLASKAEMCTGIEMVAETTSISTDIAEHFGIKNVKFINAAVTPELINAQGPVDVTLFTAIIHHIARAQGEAFVDSLLHAIRANTKHLFVEWARDPGEPQGVTYDVEAQLVGNGFWKNTESTYVAHTGFERPFQHWIACHRKGLDERGAAEIAHSLVAQELPGCPAVLEHSGDRGQIVFEHIQGTPMNLANATSETWKSLATTITDLNGRGIIHGDVRAWNIISGDVPWLVDFGLSISETHPPTAYQQETYMGLDPKDYDWFALAAMRYWADMDSEQPKDPQGWCSQELRQEDPASVAQLERERWA